jgi:predicted homoserine dehydrogenase-like protein
MSPPPPSATSPPASCWTARAAHRLRQLRARRPFAREGLLPIGLAQHVRLKRKVPADAMLTLDDVDLDRGTLAWELREEILKNASRTA